MNDDQFSGDKLYEKNDRRKIFSSKLLLSLLGAAILILLIIWWVNISGVFTKDKTAPAIYLNGNKEITVDQGADFSDPGIQAIDNKDGLITSKVIISGTVNTSIIGTYHITYKVKDKAGNITVEKRTINVGKDIEGPQITISPNGSETVSKTQTTKVSVVDSSGVKVIKYQWTTSTTKPLETTFITTFINDSIITSPENADGNYYLWIYAEDEKGNVNVVSSNVFKISQETTTVVDKTAPIVKFNPTSNNIYAKSHSTVVTLSDQSTIKSSLYKWTTSTTAPNVEDINIEFTSGDKITTPSGVTGTYYLWIYAKDSEGNYTITSSGVFKINKDVTPADDKTAPIITFNPNGNSNKAKQQSSRVTASDGSGIKKLMYKWTNSTTKPLESSFSQSFNSGNTLYSPTGVNGIYYLWIYAEDRQGNKIIEGSKGFNIGAPTITPSDTAAPTISFVTNGSGYTKASGTVVNVADASGVQMSKYIWTTSATAPAVTAFTNTFNSGSKINTPSGVTGTYYLWIYAKDNKGNSTIVGSKGFSLDNTAPKCSTNGGSSSWYNSSRTISISCNDANSGIASCNGAAGTSTSATYSSNTNKTYSYKATDKAGNSSTCSAAVKIDKTAPTCTLTGTNTTWTNKPVSVHVTWKDSDSGVNGTASYDRSWNSEVNTKTITETKKDNAGNVGTCDINVYYDKVKPTCEPNYTQTYPKPTVWTSSSRTFSVKCSDGSSGIKSCGSYSYGVNNSGYLYTYYYKLTISTTAKWYSVQVNDRAGNYDGCLVTALVDKLAPYPPTTSRTETGTGANYKVTCGSDNKNNLSQSGINSSSCLLYCKTRNTSCTPSIAARSGMSFAVNVGWNLCVATKDNVGLKSTSKCVGE